MTFVLELCNDPCPFILLKNDICHKKEQNNAICSNMDGPRDCHTEWSKSKTNIIWCHLYVESKKNDTNELIYKTEID